MLRQILTGSSNSRRCTGHVVCMGEMWNVYKILVGRRRWRWEDNIRMNHREIGWESADWMHLAQNRDQLQALVNTVMKLQDPKQVGNLLTSRMLLASQEELCSMESAGYLVNTNTSICSGVKHVSVSSKCCDIGGLAIYVFKLC
jgi:hypothetical protein